MDHYDVEAMIRDARHEVDRAIDREIERLRELLRGEIAELGREIEGLARAFHSRTDHLA